MILPSPLIVPITCAKQSDLHQAFHDQLHYSRPFPQVNNKSLLAGLKVGPIADAQGTNPQEYQKHAECIVPHKKHAMSTPVTALTADWEVGQTLPACTNGVYKMCSMLSTVHHMPVAWQCASKMLACHWDICHAGAQKRLLGWATTMSPAALLCLCHLAYLAWKVWPVCSKSSATCCLSLQWWDLGLVALWISCS